MNLLCRVLCLYDWLCSWLGTKPEGQSTDKPLKTEQKRAQEKKERIPLPDTGIMFILNF